MRKVIIPNTDLCLSRFAFGTASLFRAGTRAQRLDVLSAAYNFGFSHFDTAPYYGFGAAERDLRPILAAHPEATVATKVGIYSPGGEDQSDLAILARKSAGKLLPRLSRPKIDWTIARARASLAGSLKRLGRERIDLYLLHEPDFPLIQTDEWLRWLEDERDKYLHFGVAAETERLKPFLDDNNPLSTVIQTLDSIESQEADLVREYNRPLQITYGYVSAAIRSGENDIEAVLAAALHRNPKGSVIVSTRQPKRLSRYAEISEAFDRAMIA